MLTLMHHYQQRVTLSLNIHCFNQIQNRAVVLHTYQTHKARYIICPATIPNSHVTIYYIIIFVMQDCGEDSNTHI